MQGLDQPAVVVLHPLPGYRDLTAGFTLDVTQLPAEAGRRPEDRELSLAQWRAHLPAAPSSPLSGPPTTTDGSGDLELDYDAMALAADPGHNLITSTAANSPDQQALAFLASWAGTPAEATTRPSPYRTPHDPPT